MDGAVVLAWLAAAAVLVAGSLLVTRPWDPSFRPFGSHMAPPMPVFRAAAWAYALLDWAAGLKPGPMRAVELSFGFVSSQVLFAVSDLGIPDLLRASGPLTAPEIRDSLGLQADAGWVGRLLRAAASLGILKRIKGAPAGGADAAAGLRRRPWGGWPQAAPWRRGGAAAGAAGSGGAKAAVAQGAAASGAGGAGAAHAAEGPAPDRYALNAVSAALCRGHPCSVRDFVAVQRDHFEPMGHLAEGLREGRVPFTLSATCGGRGSFWDHIAASKAHAVTFDASMRAVENFGGAAAMYGRDWGSFDHVIDVGGGHGQFLARLLAAHPRMTGAVVDLAPQAERGEQWWRERHPELLPRAAFIPGDFFDASTLPAAPPGKRAAYVLRNILHDWADDDCVKILRALRAAAARGGGGGGGTEGEGGGGGSSSATTSSSDSAGKVLAERPAAAAAPTPARGAAAAPPVRLLVIETTMSDEVLPCLERHRCSSDILMLMAFGGARERREDEFGALFEAAGWRLAGVRPTPGPLCIVEAVPACT